MKTAALSTLSVMILLVALQPILAQTVTVTGEIELKERKAQNPVRPGALGYRSATSPEATASDAELSENTTPLVIWVEPDGSRAFNRKSRVRVLDQKDKSFVPKLLPVFEGDTVRILNSDPFYHNVYSISKTKKFDIGRRPKGKFKDVVFTEPGVVNIFCDIHSHMNAVVLVMDTNTQNWVEMTGSGTFEIQGLAPGSYTLNVYAFGYQKQTIEIEVGSGDENLNLERITLN